MLAGGAEERRLIGELSLDALVEAAIEPGQRAQPLAVFRRRARAGRGVEARGIHFGPAELGQGARERDGHAVEGHVRRQLQAVRRFQEPGGDEGGVPGVPGLQAAAEQRRLGDGAGEVGQRER